MTISLSDRKQTSVSERAHAETMRWMFAEGVSIAKIAKAFGKSKEWTRRIVRDVAYEYDEATEVQVEHTPRHACVTCGSNTTHVHESFEFPICERCEAGMSPMQAAHVLQAA